MIFVKFFIKWMKIINWSQSLEKFKVVILLEMECIILYWQLDSQLKLLTIWYSLIFYSCLEIFQFYISLIPFKASYPFVEEGEHIDNVARRRGHWSKMIAFMHATMHYVDHQASDNIQICWSSFDLCTVLCLFHLRESNLT